MRGVLGVVFYSFAIMGLVACGGTTQTPTTDRSHPAAAVSARMVLPSRTIVSGSSMPARVVISNNTHHELHVDGCISLFGIALGNNTVKPKGAWNLCSQPFTIPTGESSYPVTIHATYQECSNGPPHAGIRACGPDGQSPALPPGDYQAEFLQSSKIAAAPSPIPVRVTPRTADSRSP